MTVSKLLQCLRYILVAENRMKEQKDNDFNVFFLEGKNHYGLSSAFATAYTILKNSLHRIEFKKMKVERLLNSLLELQMELACNCKRLQSPCNLCILSRTLLVGCLL